jgi:hypothetical protein
MGTGNGHEGLALGRQCRQEHYRIYPQAHHLAPAQGCRIRKPGRRTGLGHERKRGVRHGCARSEGVRICHGWSTGIRETSRGHQEQECIAGALGPVSKTLLCRASHLQLLVKGHKEGPVQGRAGRHNRSEHSLCRLPESHPTHCRRPLSCDQVLSQGRCRSSRGRAQAGLCSTGGGEGSFVS